MKSDNKTEKCLLIDGTFTPQEAKNILVSMITSKIEYHQLNQLSSIERKGQEDVVSKKRILDLKIELDRIHQILMQAEKNNKNVTIQSEALISINE